MSQKQVPRLGPLIVCDWGEEGQVGLKNFVYLIQGFRSFAARLAETILLVPAKITDHNQ